MSFGRLGSGGGGGRTIVGPTAGSLLKGASTNRVDILMIGDSNQLLSGHGWDHGLHKAAHDRWGLYATGVISANNNNGSGDGRGYFYNSVNPGAASPHGQVTGAPTFFANYRSLADTAQYAYFRTGEAGDFFGGNNGLQLTKAGPWDVTAAIRCHFIYGVFAANGGAFTPTIRQGESPYYNLVTEVPVSCAGGADAIAYYSFDREANPAETRNLQLMWFRPGAANVSGEAFCMYSRAELTAKPAGVSVHTLHGVGGQSLYDMAAAFIAMPDETIMQMLLETRRLQGDTKRTIIWVNSGLNDRNETETSVGPLASADGDSAEAYADNLHALVTRIEDCWLKAGYLQSELAWVIMPSHPIDDPDDTELVAYRAAAAAYCEQGGRFKFVDLSALTNETEMLANGWYASGGSDRAHLASSTAYEVLAARALGAALQD